MRIRIASQDDAPYISGIQEEIIKKKWGEKGIRDMLKRPSVFSLIIEDSKTPIGFIIYTKISNEVQIFSFGLKKAQQNKGYGQRLWNYLEKELEEEK